MTRIATYECRQCGTKVVVTETGGTNLQPIYCCGMELAEVDSVKKQLAAKTSKGGGKKKEAISRKTAVKAKRRTAVKASSKKEVSKYTKKK